MPESKLLRITLRRHLGHLKQLYAPHFQNIHRTNRPHPYACILHGPLKSRYIQYIKKLLAGTGQERLEKYPNDADRLERSKIAGERNDRRVRLGPWRKVGKKAICLYFTRVSAIEGPRMIFLPVEEPERWREGRPLLPSFSYGAILRHQRCQAAGGMPQ